MSSSYQEFFEKAQKQTGVIRNNKTSSKTSQKKYPVKNEYKNNVRNDRKLKNQKGLLALISVGFLITAAGGLYTDEILQLIKKIDISFLSKAGAEETATSDAKSEKKDLSQDSTKVKNETNENTLNGNKTENEKEDVELNHLARLRERKIELDKREEELVKLEESLTQQKAELELKLKELENVRKNISTKLEEKVQNDDQKVQDLVAFYSNMKPPQAAKIIETLDEALAVRIMEKMKKKNAADIMNLLKPDKAQTLSEKYAGYRK